VNAFALRAGDDVSAFLGRVFLILHLVCSAFCVVYAVRPASVLALGPLRWLGRDIVGWLGAAFTIAGVLLTVAAQFGMGSSWRIGMSEDDRCALVGGGLYRFSRNPIYVGMMSIMMGIFLIAPHAITLALALGAWITTSAQIRLEEDFLSRLHGAAYQAYCARTRRWF